MSEPLRWLEPDSDAPSGARALLAAGSVPSDLSLGTRARVRAALRSECSQPSHHAAFWSTALGTALAVLALGWPPWLPTQLRSDQAAPAVAAPIAAPTSANPAPASTAPPTTTEAAPTEATGTLATARREPTPAQLQRWRRQRWANEKRRSHERIAAVVDAVLKPDVRLLEDAETQVGHDPERSLALIETFRKRYPLEEIPAPSVVVEVDALRRLGRFEEALSRARDFVAASRKGYYADEMRERFAFLDL